MTIEKLKKTHNYIEHIEVKAQNILILVPPGNDGIEIPFMKELYKSLEGMDCSVVMFNLSCHILGKEISEEYETEVEEVWEIYKRISRKYPTKNIHLIGKAVGGKISSAARDKRNMAVASILCVASESAQQVVSAICERILNNPEMQKVYS